MLLLIVAIWITASAALLATWMAATWALGTRDCNPPALRAAERTRAQTAPVVRGHGVPAR
ncbi:hypothetical protein [Nocardioides sp. YIM 152588]|uniref:hypothetical protein n=1 Tax=Nocardioides sp. YIM 152588 TaxID=3158259 RepID=UPI0032E42C0A